MSFSLTEYNYVMNTQVKTYSNFWFCIIHIHTYIYIYMHVHIYIYIYIHTHVYMCIYMCVCRCSAKTWWECTHIILLMVGGIKWSTNYFHLSPKIYVHVFMYWGLNPDQIVSSLVSSILCLQLPSHGVPWILWSPWQLRLSFHIFIYY
jgi:hypothetical protein